MTQKSRSIISERFGAASFYWLLKKAVRSFYYLIFAQRTYKFAVRPLLEFNSLDQLRTFCTSFPIFENCQPIRLDPEKSFGNHLLFIAAHPDDETIGAGGTMLRAIESRNTVHVIYVTDGGNGGARDYQSNKVKRATEAKIQADKMGYSYEFLGAPDGDFEVTDVLSQKLNGLIQTFNPTALFIPWLLEANAAHRRTNELFLKALNSHASMTPVYAFQVWSNVPANTFVDITAQMDKKMEAVARWESQVELFDYVHFTRGLNAHASYLQSGKGFVEGFFNLPLKDYLDLLRKYYG